MLYDWFLYPHRVAAIRPFLRGAAAPRLLDIGCGNHAPKTTKRYLPSCVYHGVDNRRWNRDAEDDACMDRYFELNLDQPGALAVVPDAAYDAVLCSHVLEHLAEPCRVVEALAPKVRPGGVFYVEVPSPRSLTLPRAAGGWMGIRGCLNFYDDDTHRTMVDMHAVAGVLRKSGFAVGAPRPRRLWRRVWGLPLFILGVLVTKGFIPASVVWDVTGFATTLTAVRGRSPESGPRAPDGTSA